CTEDHLCLVINNNSHSNRLEDIVFWYKADNDLDPFRVGDREFWRIHDRKYQGDIYEDPKTLVMYDLVNTFGSKSKYKVIMEKSH
ncbi:hypothetical protein HK102_000771, partial [Quaeritorhiza haematococci]